MRTPFAYYDPGSSSLRTCVISLFEDLEESSLTWPPAGSMRNGECFARPTQAHLISAPASSSSPGLLPTPVARDDGKSPEAHLAMKARMPGGPRGTITSLSVLAANRLRQPELLKTPTAQLAVNGGSQHPDKRREGGHGPTLADQVEHLLPTPGASDSQGGPRAVPERRTSRGKDHGPRLRDVARALLPTPAARDWKSGQSNLIGTNARPLNEVIETALLPTPRASDGPGGSAHNRSWSTTDRSLHTLVHTGELGGTLLPTPRASDGGWTGDENGRGARASSAGFGLRNVSREISRGEPTSPQSAAGKPSSGDQHPVQLSLDELENWENG